MKIEKKSATQNQLFNSQNLSKSKQKQQIQMKIVRKGNNNITRIEDALDLSKPINKLYSDDNSLQKQLDKMSPQYRFLSFTQQKKQFIMNSTEELHKILYKSLSYVLQSDDELSKFNVNKKYWKLIRESFVNIPIQYTLYQRYDFALSAKQNQIKLFQLNTGVMGHLYYTCQIQDTIFKIFFPQNQGVSSGQELQPFLISKWKKISEHFLKKTNKVYFIIDDDADQKLLALQFSQILTNLGYQAKTCLLGQGLQIGNDNLIYDKDDNCIVELIHSTFDWITILKHLDQNEEEEVSKFVKIIMNPNVIALEPIWIRLMGSKALLAVAWKLFPDHPLLLPTTFDPNNQPAFNQLKQLVEKDVNGRASMKVRIILRGQNGLFQVTEGCIYQKKYLQHLIGGKFYIVSPWIINQSYAGFCCKESEQLVSEWDVQLISSRIQE